MVSTAVHVLNTTISTVTDTWRQYRRTDRDRGGGGGRDRGREMDEDDDEDRERGKERGREMERGRSEDRGRGRERDGYEYEEKDRDRDRERERNRERSRDRERDRGLSGVSSQQSSHNGSTTSLYLDPSSPLLGHTKHYDNRDSNRDNNNTVGDMERDKNGAGRREREREGGRGRESYGRRGRERGTGRNDYVPAPRHDSDRDENRDGNVDYETNEGRNSRRRREIRGEIEGSRERRYEGEHEGERDVKMNENVKSYNEDVITVLKTNQQQQQQQQQQHQLQEGIEGKDEGLGMRNLHSPFNRDDNTSPLNLINFNPFSCRSNDSVSSSNFSPDRFAIRTVPPLLHNDDNSSDTSFDFYSICSGSENHRNWNSNGHGNLFEFGRDIESDELYRFEENEEFLPTNNNQVRKLKHHHTVAIVVVCYVCAVFICSFALLFIYF